jgi:hypothetical protein
MFPIPFVEKIQYQSFILDLFVKNKKSIDHIYKNLFLDLILFFFSACLFICQYNTIFITVTFSKF